MPSNLPREIVAKSLRLEQAIHFWKPLFQRGKFNSASAIPRDSLAEAALGVTICQNEYIGYAPHSQFARKGETKNAKGVISMDRSIRYDFIMLKILCHLPRYKNYLMRKVLEDHRNRLVRVQWCLQLIDHSQLEDHKNRYSFGGGGVEAGGRNVGSLSTSIAAF